MPLSFAFFTATASIISLVLSSPLSSSYASRSLGSPLVDCTNSAAMYDSSCWNSLDIDKYLNDPVTGWNKTTPTCSPGDNGATCCRMDEPWTTCFLRLESGRSGTDCSDLSNANDCQLPVPDRNLSPNILGPARYVAYTIVSIFQFFNSMAYDLQTARTPTGNLQSSIHRLFADSANFFSVNQTIVDVALSLGPVALPNLPHAQNRLTGLETAANTFVQSLQKAPAVAQAIWPPSSGAPSDRSPSSNSEDQLPADFAPTGKDTETLYDILDRGLGLIMSDVPTFIAFASDGAFSGDPSPDFMIGDVDALLSTSNIYIASRFLQNYGWYAVPGAISPAPDTPAQLGCRDLGNGGFACSQADGGARYRSPVTGRSYTLRYNGKDQATSTAMELVTKLDGYLGGGADSTNGAVVATPALFDGAYNCTLQGAAGGGLAIVGADGTVDSSCASVLPMYLERGSSCPDGVKQVDGKCPFGFER